MKAMLFAALLSLGVVSSRAESEARIFEGGKEARIELKEYKRGLFFGSCGPSTKSVQWEYSFTLSGQGSAYTPKDIALKDGSLNPVEVTGGKISLDEKRKAVKIDIKIKKDGVVLDFPYNGHYKLRSKH